MPKPHVSLYQACRRWTKADAQAAMSALRASGLSVTAFAARERLDAQRLYRWRRRLSATKSAALAAPAFVEIQPLPVEPVEIVLRSGRVLRVSERISTLALERLVAVLERATSC
jgi:transposase-like protein